LVVIVCDIDDESVLGLIVCEIDLQNGYRKLEISSNER